VDQIQQPLKDFQKVLRRKTNEAGGMGFHAARSVWYSEVKHSIRAAVSSSATGIKLERFSLRFLRAPR
jgi:hypothetical protein